jgi:hypothetical protein
VFIRSSVALKLAPSWSILSQVIKNGVMPQILSEKERGRDKGMDKEEERREERLCISSSVALMLAPT